MYINFEKELHKRKLLRKNQTPQEIILWNKLRNNQFGCKFRRQHSIGKYVVDFYCDKKKLVVEIDGFQHEKNKEYDELRSRYFESLGLRILRFWNNEVNINMEGVIMKIVESLNTPHP